MAMYINTNIASLNTQRSLSSSQSNLQTSLERLSSGLRVNSAKDDAAGLAIATRMDSQIRGMNQAMRNANDGISMLQVADGALSTTADALQRMRELAVQADNETNSADQVALIDEEFTQLKAEIARIASQTEFNGINVLQTTTTPLNIQVGANDGEAIALTFTAVTAVADTTAKGALGSIDAALTAVNTERAKIGAFHNRLDYAVSNLQNAVTNQSAAKSRIVDADFAAETANMTRNQILQQAGTAMLAQANQLPNQVMTLLRG